jgi:hypothetical protein
MTYRVCGIMPTFNNYYKEPTFFFKKTNTFIILSLNKLLDKSSIIINYIENAYIDPINSFFITYFFF